jgi:hypothetical protein
VVSPELADVDVTDSAEVHRPAYRCVSAVKFVAPNISFQIACAVADPSPPAIHRIASRRNFPKSPT